MKQSTNLLIALALVVSSNSAQVSIARAHDDAQQQSSQQQSSQQQLSQQQQKQTAQQLTQPGSEPSVFEQKIGNRTYASGSVLVKARMEKIWEILTDYENSPEIFANLKKCHVVEDRGSKKLVQQIVHPKGSPMKFDYIVEIDETAPRLMEWHRHSGSLKEVAGSWKLEPDKTNRNTIITYSIYIDGGMLLPAWLLRGQSKTCLPELLNAIKGAAERAAADARTTSSGNS